MTAKEKVLAEAPGWTEVQAEVALRAVEHVDVEESDGVDETMAASMRRTLRALDDEETAAGFAPWDPTQAP